MSKRTVVRIQVKSYGVILNENTMLNDEELKNFIELFPQRKEEIRYFDVVILEGNAFVMGSNATLVSVANVPSTEWEKMVNGEEVAIFDKEKSYTKVNIPAYSMR